MNPQSEQEQFLKDIDQNPAADPFNQGEIALEPEQSATQNAEDESEFKNRRERRLAAKLQVERESSIALAARLEALTEAQKARTDESADHIKLVERLYGTDTPEAREATEVLKNALQGFQKQATADAVELFRKEQREAQESQQTEERAIDTMLEEIEDEYKVDMSFDSTRKSFLGLLERMSPKDSDGNITAYADHHAVWEELQSRNQQAPDNRAKQMASRSMVASGASKEAPTDNDAVEKFLRDNGII